MASVHQFSKLAYFAMQTFSPITDGYFAFLMRMLLFNTHKIRTFTPRDYPCAHLLFLMRAHRFLHWKHSTPCLLRTFATISGLRSFCGWRFSGFCLDVLDKVWRSVHQSHINYPMTYARMNILFASSISYKPIYAYYSILYMAYIITVLFFEHL